MKIEFNAELAGGLQEFSEHMGRSVSALEDFKRDPTATVTSFLRTRNIAFGDPATFHAHAIGAGNPLPDEPELATVDRYIYVFRRNGQFEFKIVPGSPEGNDDIMYHPTGACCCCNCGCFEIS